MPTLEQLLNEVIKQRNNLVDILNGKGVSSDYTETYNSLIDKVKLINSGYNLISLSMSPDSFIGNIGDTVKLSINCSPEELLSEIQIDSFISSDISILNVSNDGIVTIMKKGLAKITCNASYKDKNVSCSTIIGTPVTSQDFLDDCAEELNKKGYPVQNNTEDEVYDALLTIAYAPVIKLHIFDSFSINDSINLTDEISETYVPDNYIVGINVSEDIDIGKNKLSFTDEYVSNEIIE